MTHILLFLSLIFGSLLNSIYCLPESDFYIALRQNNVNILIETLNNISNPDSEVYGNYVSDTWIRNTVSPPEKESNKVVNWLESNNMLILENFGDCIHAKGNVIDIEKLFFINMKEYVMGSNNIFRSLQPYFIPSELKNIIIFVEGISNPIYKKTEINPVSAFLYNTVVDNRYAGREVIHRLYNITDSDTGDNHSSLASIEYQGNSGFSQQDLLQAEQMNNVANNQVKNVVGTDAFPDTESQLDIQAMGINAPGSKLWFWDDNNWLYSLAVNMANTKIIPSVISMSWGWAEDQQCTITNCSNITSQKYVERVNVEYVKLGLRGVTITTASGDAGAPGRTNEMCDPSGRTVNAVFPGSSPWITSVGATFINQSSNNVSWTTPLCQKNGCATGTDEFVNNFNFTGWTSGGGISKFSNRSNDAKWQKDVVDAYLASNIALPKNFNTYGRAYPDVSAIGHYCPVVNSGSLEPVDGTSCSSPIFASIVSLLNAHQMRQGKPKLGFANPIWYRMAKDNPLIFNDISVGNNFCTEYNCCDIRKDGGSDFGYLASKGYDPVYGLGTPNVGLMKEWLDMNTKKLQ